MIDRNRVPSIEPIEAERLATSGEAILLDVREPGEFFQARAPGAALLPISGFIAGYPTLPRDRPVLVICQSGSRSMQATAYLISQGWPDVRNVAGGMLAWARAGLPVRTGPVEPGEGELPSSGGPARANG